MKELSSVISIYPVSELTTGNPRPWDNEIKGVHSFLSIDDFTIDPQIEDSDAGIIFNCGKVINISTPTDAELSRFSTYVKSVIIIKDTEGNKYEIGSETLPGMVLIQAGIQRSRLHIQAKTLINPF